MDSRPIWPFFFEVDILQYRSRRERTLLVTIYEDGRTHWVDHTGRFTRTGGLGGIKSDEFGALVHTRGGRPLSGQQELAEKREYTIDATLSDQDFVPIRAMIEHVGKPWTEGWEETDATRLHELLETVYWHHVNRFVHEPFNEQDSTRPEEWGQ